MYMVPLMFMVCSWYVHACSCMLNSGCPYNKAYWQWYSSCFWFTLMGYLVLCFGINTLGYSPLDLSLRASLTATTRKIMLDFY